MRRRALAGLVVVLGSLTLLPSLLTATDDGPRAVDVDLAPGGLWLTYENARVEFVTLADDAAEDPPVTTGRDDVLGPASLFAGEAAVELLVAPQGWWVVTSLGRVIAAHGAQHHGDMVEVTLNEPVVDAAVTASGAGYLMLAADGGVFTFGDASFYGSVQGIVDDTLGAGHLAADHLSAPIVTLGTTPAGYWLVAADGAVFPFGDAGYYGSFQDVVNTDNQLTHITRDWTITPPVATGKPFAADALDAPIVSLVPSTGYDGYIMLASDGGIFTYGNTSFLGSFAHRGLPPAVAIDVAPNSAGYAALTADGNTHLIGDTNTVAATAAATSTNSARRRSTARRVTRNPRIPATSTPTTSVPPASPLRHPCQPAGPAGFPVDGQADLSVGTLDVLVVFAEFDDADTLWARDMMNDAVDRLATFLKAQSYGRLEASFTVVDSPLSVAAARSNVDADGFDLVLVLPPSLYRPPRAPVELDELLRDAMADTFGLGHATQSSFDPASPDPASPDPASPDPASPDPASPDAVFQLGQFGLVGMEGWWPTSPTAGVPFTGTAYPRRSDAVEDVSIRVDHTTDLTDTFLGWSRWRLGWLAPAEVECVEVGATSFELAPLEADDPGGDTTLAVLPLADRQVLVLESRRWIGNDADVGRSGTDGPFSWSWERRFSKEGVLAYMVDPTLRSASSGVAPYALLGSDARGLLAHTPFIGTNESFTLTGANGGPAVTVAVTADDGTKFGVAVDWTAPSTAASSYQFTLTRRAAPELEPVLARSCRPAGPEGFPIDQPAEVSDGTFDVLVVFAEFGDARHDEAHFPWMKAQQYLRDTEDFLEAQSYGQLDVNFELANDDGWITLAERYSELTLPWSETSLDVVQLTWTAAQAAKAEGIDFVGRSRRFDSIAVLLPPSHFRGASAFNVEVPTDDEPTRTPASNGLVRLTSAGDPTIRSAARLGTRARAVVVPDADYYASSLRHELLHNLGLNDLYSYRSALRQVPDPSPREHFLHGVFGQMAVHGFWPVPPAERGGFRTDAAYLATGERVDDALVYTNEAAVLDEMLGWSRWRLGWLAESDVECVDVGTSTVNLAAVGNRGGEARLAVVPLGGKQLLVLEARRRAGYDADTPRVFSDGRSGYNRELTHEGVLAYLVKPTVANGNAPITVLGHTGRECTPQSPILRLDETATLTAGDTGLMLEVTVASDDGTTFGVNIDWRDAGAPANEFDLDVARTPEVDLDASGCISALVG